MERSIDMECSIDMNMQHGHGMQYGHGHGAWTWTCSMDMDTQYGFCGMDLDSGHAWMPECRYNAQSGIVSFPLVYNA